MPERGSKRGSPTHGSSSKKKSRRAHAHADKENSLNSASVVDDEENSFQGEEEEADDAEMYDDATEDNEDEALEDEDLEDVKEEHDGHEEEAADDDVPLTLQHAKGTQPRRSTAGGHKSPEAGIITRIYCENFMCHHKLTVDLCPNVNFINGQNGSGKSAILAAIKICLGSSAKQTGRAGNLKDYIRKEGTHTLSHARVQVTLLNMGSDAYKHDVYGDSITIERRIAGSSGSNGYRILDHNGKLQSQNKSDVNEMLDHLNVQIDNPVAILDQEEAKKFLTGKDSAKYEFFMKATELARVNRTLQSTLDAIERQEELSRKQHDILQPKVDHCQELKRKWKEAQELEKLQLKLSKLQAQYGWANFWETDRAHGDEVNKLETFKEKAEKKREALARDEAAVANPEGETEQKQDRVNALVEEAQHLADAYHKISSEIKESKRPLQEIERRVGKLKNVHKQKAREVAASQMRLEEARNKVLESANSAESKEARRVERLQKAEEKLSGCMVNRDALREEQSKWLGEFEEVEPQVQAAKSRVRQINSELSGVRNQVRSLQSSTEKNGLAMFGQQVSGLARLVELSKKRGDFQGEVIGPIGSYLKVVNGKEEFAALAENAMGGINTLDRFIVTTAHDGKVMRRLRHEARCVKSCGVFSITAAPRYNINPGPGVDGVDLVADIFTIENDIVFNTLVDHCKIDRVAVARDIKQSERDLTIHQNGTRAIKGRITTVHCLPRGDRWQYSGGAYAVFQGPKRKLTGVIGVDRSAAIEDTMRDQQRLTEDLNKAKDGEAKLEHEHTTAQKQWTKAKNQYQKNEQTIADLEQTVLDIKDEEQHSASNTIDMSEYEADVENAKLGLADIERQASELETEKEGLQPQHEELSGQLEENSFRREKTARELEKAEQALTQCIQTQTQTKSKAEKNRRRLEEYEAIVSDHEKRVEEMRDIQAEALRNARLMHHRYQFFQQMENSRNEDEPPAEEQTQYEEPSDEELAAIEQQSVEKERKYFEARIQKTEDKIKSERRKTSKASEGEAYEKYKKAQTAIIDSMRQMNEAKENTQAMKDDVTEREKNWKKFRKHLTKMTCIKFNDLLGLNSYSGNLGFDHGGRDLKLKVKKGMAAGTEMQDAKTLSGGEKSFTTMCLLLALGESLETPFRILDEFDVFLDSQVRKLTIETLITMAKTKMAHRQFIFITPQDLSGITPDRQLKILRLTPPERNNRAGGASQQTLKFSQA